jgi:serine/threonine protein kinase
MPCTVERSHQKGQRDLSGSVLDGRYQLVAPLGIGGMGTVYEGIQLTLEKRVAVKVLKAELAADAAYVERFLREAKSAARVGHRNVVHIIDFGYVRDGPIYYVMELLRGIDLSQLIKKRGPLPWRRTRSIILQVLAALEAAHAAGVIHRDVKPANVFLLGDGDEDDEDEPTDFVKVLDFGIAKLLGSGDLTRADEIVGTASYMAPEQAHGIVDARTDAYSVGVLMYKMLTGITPFSGVNGFEILRKHQSEPPPTLRSLVPELSPAVEALVLQALAKRPELRFQSMTEMRGAVRAISPNAAGKRHGIARAEGTPTQVRAVSPVSVEPTLERNVAAPPERKTLVPTEVTPQAPPPTTRDPFIQTERVPEFPPPGVHDAGGWIPEPTGPSGPATFSAVLSDTATTSRTDSHRRTLLKGIMVGLVVAVVLTLGFVAASLSIDGSPSDSAVIQSPRSPESLADRAERPRESPPPGVIPGGEQRSGAGIVDDGKPVDHDTDLEDAGSTGAQEDNASHDGESQAKPRGPLTDDVVKRRLIRRAKQKCGTTGSGRVEVGFSVRSDGGVMMIVAQAPHTDDAMGRCVVGIVSAARFPKGTLRRESISVRL